jgi:hypothetical protein
MIKKWQKFTFHLVFWYIIAGVFLYLALMFPSELAGDDKKVTEGYYGTERIKLLEKPVRAKSGETITYGYIGRDYVRIHKKVSKDGVTVTRKGWVGNKYIRGTQKNTQGTDDG